MLLTMICWQSCSRNERQSDLILGPSCACRIWTLAQVCAPTQVPGFTSLGRHYHHVTNKRKLMSDRSQPSTVSCSLYALINSYTLRVFHTNEIENEVTLASSSQKRTIGLTKRVRRKQLLFLTRPHLPATPAIVFSTCPHTHHPRSATNYGAFPVRQSHRSLER